MTSRAQPPNSSSAIVMSLPPDLLAFVLHALRRQKDLYRINGMSVPDGADQVVAALRSGVHEGPTGPQIARASASQQVEAIRPLLVTREVAAEMLSISLSTLKRRISSGDLHTVSVGGVVRIRIEEINDYVASLAKKAASDGDEGQ